MPWARLSLDEQATRSSWIGAQLTYSTIRQKAQSFILSTGNIQTGCSATSKPRGKGRPVQLSCRPRERGSPHAWRRTFSPELLARIDCATAGKAGRKGIDSCMGSLRTFRSQEEHNYTPLVSYSDIHRLSGTNILILAPTWKYIDTRSKLNVQNMKER